VHKILICTVFDKILRKKLKIDVSVKKKLKNVFQKMPFCKKRRLNAHTCARKTPSKVSRFLACRKLVFLENHVFDQKNTFFDTFQNVGLFSLFENLNCPVSSGKFRVFRDFRVLGCSKKNVKKHVFWCFWTPSFAHNTSTKCTHLFFSQDSERPEACTIPQKEVA